MLIVTLGVQLKVDRLKLLLNAVSVVSYLEVLFICDLGRDLIT